MTEAAKPYPGTTQPSPVEPAAEPEPTEPTAPLSLPDLALRSIGSAVAIVEPTSWEIIFENGTFFEWFGPDAETEAPLGSRIEGLDLEAVTAKLDGIIDAKLAEEGVKPAPRSSEIGMPSTVTEPRFHRAFPLVDEPGK